MTRRDKNRLRTRVMDALQTPTKIEQARAAWSNAWQYRREGVTRNDVERARLAMLKALDDGQDLAHAELAARRELAA